MITKIQTGFQMGADIAGADAAIANNIPYSGWIPKGRRTEAGPLDPKYNATEMPTTGYPPRTKKNIADSDGTAIFTHGALSGGSALTRKGARELNKPWIHVDFNKLSVQDAVAYLEAWIDSENISVLNVAGKSASKDAKIYEKVYSVIYAIIRKNQKF